MCPLLDARNIYLVQSDNFAALRQSVPVHLQLAPDSGVVGHRVLCRRIEQVNDDRQPIEVRSKRGDAVLLSRADYDALTETVFLLRVPANARRLLESVAQARSCEREAHVVM